jgi:putative lipoic acid-binding regulatory protein
LSDGHTSGSSPEQERLNDLEMIEACYAFPGDFPLAVIARNEQAVVDAVMAAATAEGRELRSHQRQESSGGKYVSHRLEVRVGSATEAHALRARLRAIDGVRTVL